MSSRPIKPVALTIAGSDCSGGAGLQADLKVWSQLGVHGSSVVTCLTAQTPGFFSCLKASMPRFVEAQLDAVLSSMNVKSVKTGMLYSRPIIEIVAKQLIKLQGLKLVVDPDLLRPIDLPDLRGNPEKIKRDTGWVPKMSLDQTLSDLLKYWRLQLSLAE